MMPWNWNGELNDEEKPKLKGKKPAESQHGGRSYYHRIHREYYNEYDDEEEEEEEEDDYIYLPTSDVPGGFESVVMPSSLAYIPNNSLDGHCIML
jgi:hypothetical protein